MPAGAGHQIIQKRLLRGVACGSPDGSMPRGAWTARARPTLLAALIRARAGNPCEDPIVFEGILYFFYFFFSSDEMIDRHLLADLHQILHSASSVNGTQL